MTGINMATYARERPGMSAFALEDGVVYHTYSPYARGLDGLWACSRGSTAHPRGATQTVAWWRRHDEYNKRLSDFAGKLATHVFRASDGVVYHTYLSVRTATDLVGLRSRAWCRSLSGAWWAWPVRLLRPHGTNLTSCQVYRARSMCAHTC